MLILKGQAFSWYYSAKELFFVPVEYFYGVNAELMDVRIRCKPILVLVIDPDYDIAPIANGEFHALQAQGFSFSCWVHVFS